MEVVASLTQGRTAAAQCGLFIHKSVRVIFEPPCNTIVNHTYFIQYNDCYVQDSILGAGRIKVTGGLMLTLHLHVVTQSKKEWSSSTTYNQKFLIRLRSVFQTPERAFKDETINRRLQALICSI